MNHFVKFAAAATLTGALALALATPSEARNGRNAAAIGGFAAGAVVGAAVAGSANNGYYGSRGYYYDEPAYAYQPAPRAYYYNDPSAPAYAYEAAPRYYGSRSSSRCGGSPGSTNYRPCNSAD
jgi:hypothetical protein